MTEHDWLTSDDPGAMMDHLRYQSYEITEYGLGTVTQSRHPPLITERQQELWVDACRAKFDSMVTSTPPMWSGNKLDAAREWASSRPAMNAVKVHIRSALLREIVGNPFRPVRLSETNPVALGPVAIECEHGYDVCPVCDRLEAFWYTSKIRSMAQAIDDRGQFEPWEMGALADELEEAGCGEEELLRHLRGEERVIRWDPAECDVCCNRPDEEGCIEHGRGCYVVDSDGGGYSHAEEVINWIPLRQPHVKGCWAIELLRGSE